MPAVWSEDYFEGAWLISRFDEAALALRSPLLSARRTGGWLKGASQRGSAAAVAEPAPRPSLKAQGLSDFQALFSRALLFLDEPDHGALRGLLNLGFRHELLGQAMPALEARLTTAMQAAQTGGVFDAIPTLIEPLPPAVMGHLLGIELPNSETLWPISDALADFIGSPAPSLREAQAAQAAVLELAGLFPAFERQASDHPAGSLMALLQRAQADGLLPDARSALAQAIMLLFAGLETTRNLLGNCLWWALSDPSRWARLDQDGPDGLSVDALIREVLRLESPVQMTGRRVAQDCRLFDQTLKRGDLVLILLGEANRDPAQFPEPEVFQPGRAGGMGLAFGSGPHVCLGAGLALLETRSFLRQLRADWPGLRLAGDVASARWRAGPVYRGLVELPVQISGAVADRGAGPLCQ